MLMRNTYRGIAPELVKLVRKAAKSAVKKARLPESEVQDIEQDLMLALLTGLKKYDDAKSQRMTFAAMLIEARLNFFYRFRTSPGRRAYFNWQTLNSPIEMEDDIIELIDLVNSDGLLAQENTRQDSPTLQNDIHIDIETAMNLLSENQRQICEYLKTMSISEIAKKLQQSKMTIYRKIHLIRELFTDAELGFYL